MTPPPDAELNGRVAVVTGANTGIGRATATELARRGATVVLACRSEEKTKPVLEHIAGTTGNHRLSFHPLDLADLAAVRASARSLLAIDRPIHLLINNAGLAGQRGVTADGFELAFGVNHLGHFLFTTELLDRLVASGPARIVNVSSDSHFQAKGLDLDDVQHPTASITGLKEYAASKLANVLFTQELARRHDPAVLSAFAVHPGVIASDVWRRFPRPVALALHRVLRMKSTAEGCRSSVLTATEPGLEARSGGYFDADGAPVEPNPVATPELAAELWARSAAWTAAAPDAPVPSPEPSSAPPEPA